MAEITAGMKRRPRKKAGGVKDYVFLLTTALLALTLLSPSSVVEAAAAAAPVVTTHATAAKKSSNVKEGLKNFVASGLAAVCAKTVLAPFDTIKTVQQQHRTTAGVATLTLFDAATMVTSRGRGFRELYAGLGVAALGSVPSVGLYFGIYSYSKNVVGSYLTSRYNNDDDEAMRVLTAPQRVRRAKLLRTVSIAASAAVGNTVASVSRVPFEVLKQQLQTHQYPDTVTALRSMLASPGSFFPLGGISSQMIRDVPYAICTLLTYEYLREHWIDRQRHAAAWRDMVAGAAAGGLGSYVTNPLDVLKTRLQTTHNANAHDAYAGVWDCATRTWTEEGGRAFLQGSVPRLLHKVPANALFFVSYELFRRLLRVEGAGATTRTTTDQGAAQEKERAAVRRK